MQQNEGVVLIDATQVEATRTWRWDKDTSVRAVHVASLDEAPEVERVLSIYEQLLSSSGGGTVALQGDDHFMGQVIGLYDQHFGGDERGQIAFFFVGLDARDAGASLLEEALSTHRGWPKSVKARVSAYKKGLGASKGRSSKVARVGSLRLTRSSSTRHVLGFNFASGELAALIEASERGRLSGAGQLGEMLTSLARGGSEQVGLGDSGARYVVDGRRRAGVSYCAISALERTWFDLPMAPRRVASAVACRLGDVASLAKDLVKTRAPLGLLKSSGDEFDAIHIDLLGRYCLDGRWFGGGDPFVMSVRPGPPVQFVY